MLVRNVWRAWFRKGHAVLYQFAIKPRFKSARGSVRAVGMSPWCDESDVIDLPFPRGAGSIHKGFCEAVEAALVLLSNFFYTK